MVSLYSAGCVPANKTGGVPDIGTFGCSTDDGIAGGAINGKKCTIRYVKESVIVQAVLNSGSRGMRAQANESEHEGQRQEAAGRSQIATTHLKQGHRLVLDRVRSGIYFEVCIFFVYIVITLVLGITVGIPV